MKNLLVFVAALIVLSCQRQASTNLRPPKDVVLENKTKDAEVLARRKHCPPNNPNCQTPPPQPPPVIQGKKGCILLDFDGQLVSNTLWNVNGDIICNPSGLTDAQIASILARVQYDYSFEDSLTITTSESVFNSFPVNKRRRVILTTSWEWFGQVGGVSYINSFNWYTDEPSFVFTSLLGLNTKYVSDASSHEAGHTFGCRHNADWGSDCTFRSEYLIGDYIMGNSYASSNPYFGVAPNNLCCTCIEDAKAIITNSVNQ